MRKFSFIIVLLSLVISGCSISFSKQTQNDNGGFFASSDGGDTWVRANRLILETGQTGDISGINTNKIFIDPSDSRGIYLASIEQGFYYTYDLARGWQYVKDFRTGTVSAIAVDPNDKCTIYISITNNIFRSDDCTRSWQKIYVDNELNTRMQTIAVDFNDSNKIFAGTTRGELLISLNKGESWQTDSRYTGGGVSRVVLDPNNSAIFFVTTKNGTLWRGGFHGDSMENLRENIKDFKPGTTFSDLQFAKVRPGLIFLASANMILRSEDYGENWTKLNLIPPDKKNWISAMAVSPNNPDRIYYLTNTTFYRSTDGGQTWVTKKLPTDRTGRDLVLDPNNDSILYMGVLKVEE